ncbi:MAG: 50S ribosomal protein L11 methyltransferase [Desulfobacterales bacterium]
MNREGADPPASDDPIQRAVCDLMSEGGSPMALQQIERVVARRLGIRKRPVRSAIRFLVQQGLFAYTQRNGTSHLEKFFGGPVRVSNRIWLCPARSSPTENLPANQILVRMQPGAAFGIGDHPTTRLALQAIDQILADEIQGEALDIGTGTGVLAIAAALLGVGKILAVDIDPCARAEAAANAAQNGLCERIEIRDLSVDQIRGCFSLICANLRPPTLARVATRIGRFSGGGTVVVLSGFRPEEWPPLAEDYRSSGWLPVWEATEDGWMAVACRKAG